MPNSPSPPALIAMPPAQAASNPNTNASTAPATTSEFSDQASAHRPAATDNMLTPPPTNALHAKLDASYVHQQPHVPSVPQ